MYYNIEFLYFVHAQANSIDFYLQVQTVPNSIIRLLFL